MISVGRTYRVILRRRQHITTSNVTFVQNPSCVVSSPSVLLRGAFDGYEIRVSEAGYGAKIVGTDGERASWLRYGSLVVRWMCGGRVGCGVAARVHGKFLGFTEIIMRSIRNFGIEVPMARGPHSSYPQKQSRTVYLRKDRHNRSRLPSVCGVS